MVTTLLSALFISFITLFSTTFALYGSDTDVIELTPSNFKSKVLDSDAIWIVEFYAPWCGHCRAFTPEYSKAATALKGIVNVGAVDADNHQSLGSQYGVRGFPTVKVFGTNKNSPQDYQGPRTAQGLVDSALQELRKVINARMGQKSGGSSSSGGKKGDPKDVIELTDSNFKEMVLDSEDMWLVEFFAPWCPHCKNLEPQWASAATELKGKVKLGAVDSTVHTIISNKYGVKGYPTIKYFPAGKKDGTAGEFDGGRTAADIVAWALDKFAQSAPPPEVKQVTNLDDVKKACEEHQLCILSILPHILDCQSQCRNDYIDILKTVSEKYKRHRWGWIWAEALAQPELEDALGIGGFGYPAMAAVNIRKMKYSLLRGSFSSEGISEFIREVSVGRGSSIPVKGAKLPVIHVTEPWDGKDGVLPAEEDIDLSADDEETSHNEL